MPTQRYVLLGNPLSLVCGRGLDSNPAASITWQDPNNAQIMDNARYNLENGTEVVRLNFTRTILSDTGIWTCEVTVRSERHVVNNEGNLVQGAVAVIGAPIQHEFMVIVIGTYKTIIYSMGSNNHRRIQHRGTRGMCPPLFGEPHMQTI